LEILIWNIGACLEFGIWDLVFHHVPSAYKRKNLSRGSVN
jgi:hypothetical protein